MAKDKTDRSPTPVSGSKDMVDPIEKKERKEKMTNKRKIEVIIKPPHACP